jgi:hypothetical protein
MHCQLFTDTNYLTSPCPNLPHGPTWAVVKPFHDTHFSPTMVSMPTLLWLWWRIRRKWRPPLFTSSNQHTRTLNLNADLLRSPPLPLSLASSSTTNGSVSGMLGIPQVHTRTLNLNADLLRFPGTSHNRLSIRAHRQVQNTIPVSGEGGNHV